MAVPNTNTNTNTRRKRVRNMLQKNHVSSHNPKLTRNNRGKRNLLAPRKQFRFSNGANNGNLLPTEVYGRNGINALSESRKSIQTTRPPYKNVGLNEKQSKLFANLSAAYNEPEDMLNTLKQFEKRIYSMYAN
jgi:hypothetical protein